MPSVSQTLARVVGPTAPLAFQAFDGSTAGPADAPVRVTIRSERALRHIVTAPGELGLARAYVSGEVDLEGEVYTALAAVTGDKVGALSWRDRAEVIRDLGLGTLRPLPPPPQEVRGRFRLGARHGRLRDAHAISHHYDVSNRFYELVLGPSMVYTCAVFPTAAATLEQAQEAKHDLVARKLGLKPGMRLLDVGCGWGGMVRHAARHYGVRALGVTLSRQQAEWGQKAIAEAGLGELAEIRHCDYRDVAERGFDAISSIGLTEHIGRSQLPGYVRFLAAALRPGGRLLNHAIMRPTNREPALARRGFIQRYVFPDGELLGLGAIATVIQDNGLEIRHEENLREHYALTLAGWCANLDRNWSAAVQEVGQGTARVWALYMAGSRLGFEQDRIELHQVLAVRSDGGASGMPLRPDW